MKFCGLKQLKKMNNLCINRISKQVEALQARCSFDRLKITESVNYVEIISDKGGG